MNTDAEVIVIGAGMAGMATALRLQAAGVSTLVLEAHHQVGGCAGFFRTRGFSFDVGATTFVDFEPGGVGGKFLEEIGLGPLPGEALPGYKGWLPDRTVTLYRDQHRWQQERLQTLGHSNAHKQFWALLDKLAATFWDVSRQGIRLPVRCWRDVRDGLRILPWRQWPLARYLSWTMADALRAFGLEHDRALRALLGMLIQDTVHSTVEEAPLINSALGVTIRGAGLTRPRGGARGFWRALRRHYRALGGSVLTRAKVERVERKAHGGFCVHGRRGVMSAPCVVSTLPIWNTSRLGLPEVSRALEPYQRRDQDHLGGAIVVFLGVPESEVAGEEMTHHQVLVDYEAPLCDGNNMFLSVSAPGDTESAPEGYRAVMISTHCELEPWEHLSSEVYQARKKAMGERLLQYARRVYPQLGREGLVFEVGTPRTYARFTGRHRGAVGGVRQTLSNTNQFAVPYDVGVPGFWQAGDTTWPGLGTVACTLASKHISTAVMSSLRAL